MRRPEGTFQFRYAFDGLFDRELGHGLLVEIVSGQVLLRLERDADLILHFIHSSPGTGTRDASISIEPLMGSESIWIALVWSPQETRLHVGGAADGGQLLTGVGRPSKRQFRVDADGAIHQVGGDAIDVMGVRVYSGGRLILQATALETWNQTIKAVQILLGGSSPDGYLFEVVQANLVITILVTGFETYCNRRFIELEEEGMRADFTSLASKFLTRSEHEHGQAEAIVDEAAREGITPARKLVEERRINFQSYDNCKAAFNKGYGIKFGVDLNISNTVLEELQQLIGFRHRIIHVSPITAMLNEDRVPPEEPVFSKAEYAQEALATFDSFVQALHSATLRLRPRD